MIYPFQHFLLFEINRFWNSKKVSNVLVYLQGIWQNLVKKKLADRCTWKFCWTMCSEELWTQRKKNKCWRKTKQNEEIEKKTRLKMKEKIKNDANIKESGSLTRTASKTNREILFADRCSAKSAIARHCTGWGGRATALSKPPKCNSAHYIG